MSFSTNTKGRAWMVTLYQSHVEPQLGGKKELTAYLLKQGKYAEKNEKILYST